MNQKVYKALKIIVPIIAVLNFIFVIIFLAEYSNYCEFSDLIKEIEEEQDRDYKKMSPFTKVFCNYGEGENFTRGIIFIYFLLFNILQLASIITAFISYIAFCWY